MALKNEIVSEQHTPKDASHGTFKLAIMNWRLIDSTCSPLQKKIHVWLQTMMMYAKEYEWKLCQPNNDDELETMIDFCWFVN